MSSIYTVHFLTLISVSSQTAGCLLNFLHFKQKEPLEQEQPPFTHTEAVDVGSENKRETARIAEWYKIHARPHEWMADTKLLSLTSPRSLIPIALNFSNEPSSFHRCQQQSHCPSTSSTVPTVSVSLAQKSKPRGGASSLALPSVSIPDPKTLRPSTEPRSPRTPNLLIPPRKWNKTEPEYKSNLVKRWKNVVFVSVAMRECLSYNMRNLLYRIPIRHFASFIVFSTYKPPSTYAPEGWLEIVQKMTNVSLRSIYVRDRHCHECVAKKYEFADDSKRQATPLICESCVWLSKGEKIVTCELLVMFPYVLVTDAYVYAAYVYTNICVCYYVYVPT